MKVEFIQHNDNEKRENDTKIPEKLFQLLKSHPNEFGFYINNQSKSSNMELYEIKDTENNLVMGYFWIDKKKEGYFFSVVIEDEFRRKGLAKESLKKAKEILKERGKEKIYALATRNTADGIIVRRWLLREKFMIIEKNKFWLNKSDEEYVEKRNDPIYFYLNI